LSIPPTLLLADDSVTIQRVVALTFADQPVRLVVAKDGQDAINRMATERPDVVLADTNMPCVDGYEVAKWVRQQPHLSTVPVLLLAGASDPVDEQRLHDSGANGVLEKPFEPTHVISRVKELLGMKAVATAAPTGRLLTPPEVKPERLLTAPAEPVAPVSQPAPEAPRPSVASPVAAAAALGPGAPPVEMVRVDAPLDDICAGYDARRLAQDPVSATSVASSTSEGSVRQLRETFDARPEVDSRDWFSAVEAASPGFYTGPESVSTVTGSDARVSGDTASPRAPAPGLTAGAPADVFASLLAAEQGDPTAIDAQRRAAAQMTDEMLGTLAGKVVERLQPAVLRDELQRALGTSLRQTVTDTVRDSVATETRAAVAEAVQAAVDGSLVGTVRGALNEAVTAAVPPAVASAVSSGVSGRVDAAVQESVSRTLPAAVEKAVQEFVVSRITVVVRDTVEQELRASIGPLIQETVRDVVHETSERLVREEIAKIRGRRAS
jgi:CheY-like chemotaxis protein